MTTLVGTQSELVDATKAMLELEYDSLELYEAVINRLQDERLKTAISNFKEDHQEHIKRIINLLNSWGAEFTKGPDGTQILAIAKVVLKKMLGDDIDILKTMVPAEEDNITAYSRLLKYDDLSQEAVEIFEKGLRDEEKHRDSILSKVGK